MKKLILASASKQRERLLAILGIPFTVIPPNIDEKAIQDQNFSKRAEKIARAKARLVAAKHKGVIISADTFCVLGDRILEKPSTIEEAKDMLLALSEKTHICYTGFCYLDPEKNIDFSTTSETHATFRKLYHEEIELFVKKFPVTTWAAAYYPAHPYSSTFVKEVDGSFGGYASLPFEFLIPLLIQSGFTLDPK